MLLTEPQEALRRELREFAEREFRGKMMRHSRGPEYPRDGYRKVCEAGYMGMMIPRQYGGQGKGVVEYCLLLEEISRVDHNVSWAIDSAVGVASVINRLGTEAQKKRYLPGIASGEWVATFALSDLSGGSNVRNMGTRAARQPDGSWRIEGRKVHIHNCDLANLWLIFAGSDDGQEAMLYEGNQGIVLEQTFQPFGFRSAPCFQVHFDDVVAGDDGLLGERGKGLMAALTGALNYTRIGNASIVIGIAHAAFDVAMSFMMGRKLQQGYVSDQQAVQHMLADLWVDLEAASLLRWDAAVKYDSRATQAVRESSQAKLYATEKATHICGTLLRLLGAYGSYEQFPLSDFFASCKTLEIGSGASEVHRNNIARELLREYDARFESGELMKWAETETQESLLRVNERSARVLDRVRSQAPR